MFKQHSKRINSVLIELNDLSDDLSSLNDNLSYDSDHLSELNSRLDTLNNLLNINDIIIEVQKTPVKSSSGLKRLVDNIFKKGEKTLLLTVINKNNQRRYLGVKIN